MPRAEIWNLELGMGNLGRYQYFESLTCCYRIAHLHPIPNSQFQILNSDYQLLIYISKALPNLTFEQIISYKPR